MTAVRRATPMKEADTGAWPWRVRCPSEDL